MFYMVFLYFFSPSSGKLYLRKDFMSRNLKFSHHMTYEKERTKESDEIKWSKEEWQ